MKAALLLRERVVLDDDAFADIVIWRVPKPVRASAHRYKYRLALIVEGICVLRYDNEAGKGDHKHIGARQESVRFGEAEGLIDAFWADVDQWLAARENSR